MADTRRELVNLHRAAHRAAGINYSCVIESTGTAHSKSNDRLIEEIKQVIHDNDGELKKSFLIRWNKFKSKV